MSESIKESRNLQSSVMVWMRLARVYNKIIHTITEHLRQWDISLATFDLLIQVGAYEGLTQQELADRLLVTKGDICYMVDKLEQIHFLKRSREGRAKRLFLTEQGRQLLDEIMPLHQKLVSSLFAPLSEEDHRVLLSMLRTLDKSLM